MISAEHKGSSRAQQGACAEQGHAGSSTGRSCGLPTSRRWQICLPKSSLVPCSSTCLCCPYTKHPMAKGSCTPYAPLLPGQTPSAFQQHLPWEIRTEGA